MFKVRNRDIDSEFFCKVYTVYSVRSNPLIGTPRTEFLIYDSGDWKWVNSDDYYPIREENNYE